MIYVKILCKLQALLDYLSETSSLCWPHYKNGLQVLVVYTDVNNEVNVSRVFFFLHCAQAACPPVCSCSGDC